MGRELVRQLFVLMRMARTHGANNDAWTPAMERVRQVVDGSGAAELKLADNALYWGDERLKPDREGYAAEVGLIDAFGSHGVGAILLLPGYREDVLKDLLTAWGGGKPEDPEHGFSVLEDVIASDDNISLSPASEQGQTPVDSVQTATAIYATTMNAVSEVMESVKVSQALPLKRAKRVMHRLVDQLLADPSNLMGLTTLRCYDEYTYHHSVNVCVLALAMGRKMGLPKPMMAQLGLASLFHDLGKSHIPVEVLNKPGEFNEQEWQAIRTHPVQGVKTLVRMKGTDHGHSRVLTGSFEHHMNYDHSGYPKLPNGRNLSLYGRVISLADCYDAMTSSRVYNRTPITPERALRFMLNKAGTTFDPVLTKVFVNAIGIFPVGTLLLLSTGELAVVVATHDDPTLSDRPIVRLIADANGHELADPADVALDDKLPGTDRYARDIERVLDPATYGIDVSRYFL